MKVLKGKEGGLWNTENSARIWEHLRLIHQHVSVILHHFVQLLIFARKI